MFGEYITLNPEYKDNVSSFFVPKVQRNVLDNKYLAKLINRPIHIVDELGTDQSKKAAQRIKYELEYFYNATTIIGELDHSAYNIRIIHDTDYYAENNISDIHNDVPYGIIAQHITIESLLDDGMMKKKHLERPHQYLIRLCRNYSSKTMLFMVR